MIRTVIPYFKNAGARNIIVGRLKATRPVTTSTLPTFCRYEEADRPPPSFNQWYTLPLIFQYFDLTIDG